MSPSTKNKNGKTNLKYEDANQLRTFTKVYDGLVKLFSRVSNKFFGKEKFVWTQL